MILPDVSKLSNRGKKKYLEVEYEIFDPGYEHCRLGYNIQRLVADFKAGFGNFTGG